MSTGQRHLPLFPLNVVLFPNAPLPLQIFEERYKLMIQRCLDGDSEFGAVLIKSGMEVGGPAEPYPVGTVTRIVGVNKADDGRMFLSTMGQSRFRIKEITQSRPYLEGQVDLLEEARSDTELSPDEDRKIREAVTQHMRLVLGTRGGWVREPKLPGDAVALSYFIGAALQASLAEKQSLLEEPSAVERLRAELPLLERDLESLKERVSKELMRRFSNQ